MTVQARSRAIVVVRAVLLAAAAGALALAVTLTRRAPSGAAIRAAPAYACPMHPEVTAPAAADCPICRMALERITPLSGRPASSRSQSFTLSVDAPDLLPHDLSEVARRRSQVHIRGPAFRQAAGTVTALLYNEDVAGLPRGARGTFMPSDRPNARIPVMVTGEPPIPDDPVTAQLQLSIVGADRNTAATGAGWVELAPVWRDDLVIPAVAVLESRDGPFVLIVSGEGRTFTRRPVRIGRIAAGWAVVQEGVEKGERLVGMSAFLLEAERRLAWGRQRPEGKGP